MEEQNNKMNNNEDVNSPKQLRGGNEVASSPPLRDDNKSNLKRSLKERWLDNWNRVDKRCPTCNQVTKVERGITRQNVKRLIWSKPNINDMIILFMLVMVLLLAYRYKIETAQAMYTLNNLDQICLVKYAPSTPPTNYTNPYSLNYTFINSLISLNNSNNSLDETKT